MKKLFFLLATVFCAATGSYAQYPNVATLTHDSDVKAFYGDSAFVKAMEVAADGDYVTLSSGRFVAPIITKAVTVRGAGMWNDSTDPKYIIAQTIVEGTLDFAIPEATTQAFSMEGVYVRGASMTTTWLRNASFVKCEFGDGWVGPKSGTTYEYAKLKDVSFMNCYIQETPSNTANNKIQLGGNILAVNSYIKFLYCYTNVSGRSYANIFNCYLYGDPDNYENCMIYNSIVASTGISDNYCLPSSATAYNCVAGYFESTSSSSVDFFSKCYGSGNTTLDNTKSLWTGEYKLTDEAAAKYLGTDGTQVGMYGGASPFSPIPNYPRIKKFNVASQPTADGKLDVEIQVSTYEAEDTDDSQQTNN